MLTLEVVAEELSLSEEVLLQQSLVAFLLREIGLIEDEIARLRERYGLLQPNELKTAIAEGRIASHPAWEDYIDWQNALASIKSIHQLLTESGNGSTRTLFDPLVAGAD